MVKELKDLHSVVNFSKMGIPLNEVNIWTFSDSSLTISPGLDYGQTVIITYINAGNNTGINTFHAIDWSIYMQHRVNHSSYVAEILSCAEADDREYYVKQAVRSIIMDKSNKHISFMWIQGVYSTPY